MKYSPLLRDRAEEMTALWNAELGCDFPMRNELLIQNSFEDDNVLERGSFLAIDEDGIVAGFIITKTYSESVPVPLNRSIGWIQVLLVATRNREKGLGSELLRRAEKELAKAGAKKILLGKDVWHYFPGIPDQYREVKQWFMKRGYQSDGMEFDLLTELPVLQVPEVDGATFQILDPSDKDQLIEFLHRNFPGRWEYEGIKYFERGGNGQEFVVLKKQQQVIGFCRINGPFSAQIAQNVYWSPLFPDGLGGMGPLGIARGERGKGYGFAIVCAGLAYLGQRGLKHIVIDWTQLLDFYKKAGAHPWKAYATFSKELNDDR